VNADGLDHVNLRIAADGLDDARAFYADGLGFELENVDRFSDGDKPFFDVRLSPGSVLHLWPSEEFDRPGDGRENFDHICVRLDEPIDGIEETLDDARIAVENRLDDPLGATGTGPSLYVRDPFGYLIELKVGRGGPAD
jgi:lactoylglutathione lyase